MERAIVHVGPHKTGSTYLQTCLRYHREALLARGFVVPEAWEHAADNPSHTGVLRALDSEAKLARARAVLERDLAPLGHTLLISAEELSTPRADRLPRLAALLHGLRVTIVFYVRRWSDLLPSGWQETVKQGQDFSFPDFYVAHVRNPRASQIFNLDLRLQPLAERFGRENLRLVCYTVLREQGADLFQHFAASFLDWEDPPVPPGNREMNASRSEASIELLRMLNQMEFAHSGRRSAALRDRFDRAAAELNLARILDALEAHMVSTLCSDGFPDVHALHERLYAEYRDNIVPPALPRLFFAPARREVLHVKDNTATQRDIFNEVQRIFDAVRSR